MPPLAVELTKSKSQSTLPLQSPQLTIENGLALPDSIQDFILDDVETRLGTLLNNTSIQTTEYDLCDNPFTLKVHDAIGTLVKPYTSHQIRSSSGCEGQTPMVQSRAMNTAVPLAPSLSSDSASSTFTNMKKMSRDSKYLSENVEERVAENLAYIQNVFNKEQQKDIDFALVGSWMRYDPSKRQQYILECDIVGESNDIFQWSRLEHSDNESENEPDNDQMNWEY
jgi:hypothetical protein